MPSRSHPQRRENSNHTSWWWGMSRTKSRYKNGKQLIWKFITVQIKIRIYKTIILPVVLYGCETCSVTLREEHRLIFFLISVSGLAFDDWDLDFYTDLFKNRLNRNPTSVECFDLAQSNSEHSRHWFFKVNIFWHDYFNLLFMSNSINQWVVKCWFCNVQSGAESQMMSCKVRGGWSDTGVGFSMSFFSSSH
jgi:hypothetical protein